MTKTVENVELITVQDAPNIPGLQFRRFRGEADYPLMVAVLNGSKEADGIERTPSVENMQRWFANLDNCNPYQDILFAEIDGDVIGYSRVWWSKEFTGEYVYTHIGILLPKWRRKGIGTAMLHYNENRLREIAKEHPSDSEKLFQSWASEKEESFINLMKNEAYQTIRYFFEMTRLIEEPIPDAPMPEGLEVRLTKEDEYRKVFAANDEGFQDHWGHVPLTENGIKRYLESPRFNPKIWKVAWDGDEVAGMVLNFVDEDENKEFKRKRGYTEEIVVRRPYRMRGLAKSLVAQSIAMFREMGMEETALGVDAENPNGALRLYEGMGYKSRRQSFVFRKPME